jgi:hypothetical protein
MPDEDQEDEEEDEEAMKERAASIREQSEWLRAGRPRVPTNPREFVDQQTWQRDDKAESESEEEPEGGSEEEPKDDG